MVLMMMQQFRSEIEAYLRRTGTKPSTFGRCFVCDPGFVSRIRAGGEARPSTIEKIRDLMHNNPSGPKGDSAPDNTTA
ncbi:hypothetical protein [Limimaricola pyoseonensis]|uniref:hypothetical protein n=1 Tax=Limimaricola pyoseonensis TaxID=521013 RepID=UPI000B7ED3DB|nr:hypothetical protein [Limimaricola pyoseonensis]